MSNTWYEKLIDTARDVAPTVVGGAAMAANGGNPALGGLVSSIVGRLVGEPAPDLEKASQQILGDPRAVSSFRKEMREAEIRELEIRTKDTQSARGILKYSKGPVAISSLVVAAFSALVFMVMFVSIPEASESVAYILMGSLAAGFSQVLNFWLGTSVGSKEKDSTISRFASAAEKDQRSKKQTSFMDEVG